MTHVGSIFDVERYKKIKLILDSTSPRSARDDPLYGWHPYQAKKPPNIVRKCLEMAMNSLEFEAHEIMLDPFAGSGVHGGEALSLGIRVALLDVCPLAVKIMRWTLSPFPTTVNDNFKKVFENVFLPRLKQLADELYSTTCPWCGRQAVGLEFRYDCVDDSRHPGERKWRLKAVKYRCPKCGKMGWKLLRGATIKNPPKELDIIEMDKLDAESGFNDYTGTRILGWRLLYNTRINVHEDMYVEDLYTGRNLQILERVKRAIDETTDVVVKDLLKAVLSSSLHLVRITDYKRQVPQNFYIPREDAVELNVAEILENRYKAFLKAKEAANNRIRWWLEGRYTYFDWIAKDFSELESGDAAALIMQVDAKELSKHVSTVKIIHTDPPYADQVPYMEIYAPYFAWLDLVSYNEWLRLAREEIIISDSPEREKGSEKDYAADFYKAFKEISRVVPPNDNVLQLWYACRDEASWSALVDQLNDIGFERVAESSLVPRGVHTWKEVISLAQDPMAAVRSAEVIRHYAYTGRRRTPSRPSHDTVPRMFVEYALDKLKQVNALTYQELLYSFYLWFLDLYDAPPPNINYLEVVNTSGVLKITESELRVGTTAARVKLIVPTSRAAKRQTYLEEWS